MALLLLRNVLEVDVISSRRDRKPGSSLAVSSELPLASDSGLVYIADFSHIHNALSQCDPWPLRVSGTLVDVATVASKLIDLLLRVGLPLICVFELHFDLFHYRNDVLKMSDRPVRQLSRFLEPGLVGLNLGAGSDDTIG